MMTDWYPPSIMPVRDGLYVARYMHADFPSECWSMMRWDCSTRSWYAAGSKGTKASDRINVIGMPLRHQWRGLKEEVK